MKQGIDWVLVLGGIVVAILGIAVMAYPGLTLAVIAIMAGVSFLFAGCIDLVFYIRMRHELDLSIWALLYAVLDIIIGLMFLIHPLALAAVIPWLVGLFVLIFGISEIAGSLRIRSTADSSIWIWMIISGVFTSLLGILFFVMPASMALFMGAFVLLRGISLIIYGVGGNRAAF